METLKIAFFCWESLHAERVGGLASAATNLAESLAKSHEVHYFTRGSIPDQAVNDVQYHYCQPKGGNPVAYCHDMSMKMVGQFRECDSPGRFDILHFHDWHAVQALHHLRERDTILTFHSTEFGRNGNQAGDWWEYREVSGKEWYGGLVAKRVTTVSATLRNEVMQLYNIPDWKCDVVPNGVIPRQYPGRGRRGRGEACLRDPPLRPPHPLHRETRVPERPRPPDRGPQEGLPRALGCEGDRGRGRRDAAVPPGAGP